MISLIHELSKVSSEQSRTAYLLSELRSSSDAELSSVRFWQWRWRFLLRWMRTAFLERFIRAAANGGFASVSDRFFIQSRAIISRKNIRRGNVRSEGRSRKN